MEPKMITDANFDLAEASKNPRFVEFFAPWCPHCQHMMPIIAELARKYGNEVDFFLVDTDESPKACDKYGVTSMPTMFFFKKGSAKHEATLNGEQDPDALEDIFEKLV